MVGRVLVVGGTGFLGQAVCRAAVQRGLEVVSLSRTGAAPAQAHRYPWTARVKWMKGNALDITSLQDALQGSTAVVHAVGTLLESTSYKDWVKPTRAAAHRSETTTYEAMNRDTAISLADAAAACPSISKFVFVSAATAPPLVDLRYLQSKREAEAAVEAHAEFATVILRPGFVFDEEDPKSSVLALGARTAAAAAPCLGSMIPADRRPAAPIGLQTFAQAVVNSILLPNARGVYDVDAIRNLARQAA